MSGHVDRVALALASTRSIMQMQEPHDAPRQSSRLRKVQRLISALTILSPTRVDR
jgi:hypothetical protein